MHFTVQIWIVLSAQPFLTFTKTANGQCLHESRERNVSISLSLYKPFRNLKMMHFLAHCSQKTNEIVDLFQIVCDMGWIWQNAISLKSQCITNYTRCYSRSKWLFSMFCLQFYDSLLLTGTHPKPNTHCISDIRIVVFAITTLIFHSTLTKSKLASMYDKSSQFFHRFSSAEQKVDQQIRAIYSFHFRFGKCFHTFGCWK